MKLTEAFRLYDADKKLLGYSPHTLKAYGLRLSLLVKYYHRKGELYNQYF